MMGRRRPTQHNHIHWSQTAPSPSELWAFVLWHVRSGTVARAGRTEHCLHLGIASRLRARHKAWKISWSVSTQGTSGYGWAPHQPTSQLIHQPTSNSSDSIGSYEIMTSPLFNHYFGYWRWCPTWLQVLMCSFQCNTCSTVVTQDPVSLFALGEGLGPMANPGMTGDGSQGFSVFWILGASALQDLNHESLVATF